MLYNQKGKKFISQELPIEAQFSPIADIAIEDIDQDGYLRRDLQAISNDLAFTQNVEATTEELEQILKRIQNSITYE